MAKAELAMVVSGSPSGWSVVILCLKWAALNKKPGWLTMVLLGYG